MRLGPALLVALLPLLAGANFSSVTPVTSAFINGSSSPIDKFGGDALTTVPSFDLVVDSDGQSSNSSASRVLPRSTKPHRFYTDDNEGYSYARQYDNDSVEDDEEVVEHITTETSAFKKENIAAGNLRTEKTIKKEKALTVGYLTAVKGELKERQGLSVSGALTMALNKVRIKMVLHTDNKLYYNVLSVHLLSYRLVQITWLYYVYVNNKLLNSLHNNGSNIISFTLLIVKPGFCLLRIFFF